MVVSGHGLLCLLLWFLACLNRMELQDPGSQVHLTVEIYPHTSVWMLQKGSCQHAWLGGSTDDGCSEVTVEMHFLEATADLQRFFRIVKLHCN